MGVKELIGGQPDKKVATFGTQTPMKRPGHNPSKWLPLCVVGFTGVQLCDR